ncbi:hypothetical protein Enr10x_16390 [Gimesia panareensis]|uniref:Natural resistance-associated macrophage protein n=1 Tax=Gimesia panareensis TaxID=2527978 RepID=A0A517Q3Y8_9PLAN|nr:Nramp family divalent metal transporter [Gimesia panareensis]QDT26338.1 hypothetical protein Enr10x_16390 [Gimesia panareensis]
MSHNISPPDSSNVTGDLAPWGQEDLPAPPPFTIRNLFRTIGPGAILLAGSIGGGEWLIGPTITVKYGMSILWIATVAIALQLLFNLEAIRYTLYTGEPILVGIMRLRPGSKFWAGGYIFAAVAQLGVPALAAGCASVLFATFAGRMAGDGDATALHLLTYLIIAITVGILLSGKTIERMLEYFSWVMIAFIFSFLIAVNLLFVPFSHWLKTLTGFFQFGSLPANLDPLLLATFAATAGSGGIGNLVITNWYRDKGFGMGAKVGSITSAFSHSEMQLSPVGKVFPITEENLTNWNSWWKYVSADQVWLWGMGCLIGMFLNVNLATAVIPENTNMEHLAAGAFQARYMAEQLWTGFWWLALLNGFWVLMSTHLSNTDVLIRTVTDIVWVASPHLRERRKMSVSRLYYFFLAIATIWGLLAVHWGHAIQLFKVLGAVAGPVLAIAALQILIINTRLLPQQLKPPLWRRGALIVCAICYGSLSAAFIWDLFFSPK